MAPPSSSSVEATPPPWEKLPGEITALILSKLDSFEILTTAQKVCPTWRRVTLQYPSVWRCIDLSGAPEELSADALNTMCRRAVDLSQGQLIDINIDGFGTDDLLHHISQRSSQLIRLRLACSFTMTDDALAEALKRFPLLEELHLYNIIFNVEPAIEAIGSYCPLLKSFELDVDMFEPFKACDVEALLIAKNMPRLRHLGLYGNKITNVGLQAILDSCPNLESLDLRLCLYVDLGGDLGELCSRRIKDLKRPEDLLRISTYVEIDADLFFEYEDFDG